MKFSNIAVFATVATSVSAIEPNPPAWDTNHVKIFKSGADQASSQSILDKIHAEMGGKIPAVNGQFSSNRYALFFEPGVHNVNVDVGYYVTVHGLGKTPTDTTIANVQCLNLSVDTSLGALDTFWRSVENVRIPKQMTWAVSQASPMRRVEVDGDLHLFDGAGYASGGYMAEVKVNGKVNPGGQQQWFGRNNESTSWTHFGWNMVNVGSTGAPQTQCGANGSGQSSNVAATPIISEKPYIIIKNGKYVLMVPGLETNKVGTTKNWQNGHEVDFSDVYVASASDSAAHINSKLAEGLHLVLQPGIYNLDDSINVNNANTVVIGLGQATLVATNGKPAIQVGNVDGVKVSGVLLQAGPQESQALLMWGQTKNSGSKSNPGVIQDVWTRAGGPNDSNNSSMKAKNMMQVNSDNVIIDNVWLWRADHDVAGPVMDSRNPVETGLLVNGDNVTGYGLAAEHCLGDMTVWNGENGHSFFYQSEFPYDVTQANYADKGYVAFRIGDNVQHHHGIGIGGYSFFRDHDVEIKTAIAAPERPGITLVNSLVVFLSGKGGIKSIVDGQGPGVLNKFGVQYDCDFNNHELLQSLNTQYAEKFLI